MQGHNGLVAPARRPADLERLVDHYRDRAPGAEQYNPDVWVAALARVADERLVRGALEHPAWTTALGTSRNATDRTRVAAAVRSVDFGDDDELLSAWLLVQAWGNGLRSHHGRRNTAAALSHRDQLLANLRTTASILRESPGTESTAAAYRAWRTGIGINESFFTKWFAFAGVRPGRVWQPLILDRRVWRTLNKTLALRMSEAAGTTSQWVVYRTYVETVHDWAGDPDVAQRLEWVLFMHNGLPLPTDEGSQQFR